MFLIGFEERNLHVTLFRFLGRFLHNISVGFLQILAVFAQLTAVYPVQIIGGGSKNTVVETDDIGFAPPVGSQCPYMDGEMLNAVVQTIQNPPVTIPPTVNGLFDISHNQAVRSLRKPFEQKQFEIPPLHSAGILKLVYHHVADIGSYLFEYKRGITVFHQLMKQGIGVRQ